jgi:hypothetical protein
VIKQAVINRFLTISYLYFQLTEQFSEEIPAIEIEEWMEIINSDVELADAVNYSV